MTTTGCTPYPVHYSWGLVWYPGKARKRLRQAEIRWRRLIALRGKIENFHYNLDRCWYTCLRVVINWWGNLLCALFDGIFLKREKRLDECISWEKNVGDTFFLLSVKNFLVFLQAKQKIRQWLIHVSCMWLQVTFLRLQNCLQILT